MESHKLGSPHSRDKGPVQGPPSSGGRSFKPWTNCVQGFCGGLWLGFWAGCLHHQLDAMTLTFSNTSHRSGGGQQEWVVGWGWGSEQEVFAARRHLLTVEHIITLGSSDLRWEGRTSLVLAPFTISLNWKFSSSLPVCGWYLCFHLILEIHLKITSLWSLPGGTVFLCWYLDSSPGF